MKKIEEITKKIEKEIEPEFKKIEKICELPNAYKFDIL